MYAFKVTTSKIQRNCVYFANFFENFFCTRDNIIVSVLKRGKFFGLKSLMTDDTDVQTISIYLYSSYSHTICPHKLKKKKTFYVRHDRSVQTVNYKNIRIRLIRSAPAATVIILLYNLVFYYLISLRIAVLSNAKNTKKLFFVFIVRFAGHVHGARQQLLLLLWFFFLFFFLIEHVAQ